MNTPEILETIDQEISKLQQARALLAGAPATQAAKSAAGKRRGRPKGSVAQKADAIAPKPTQKAKRVMSAEGKARIAAAQSARWAAQKKSSKPAAKKSAVEPVKKAVTAARPAAKKIAAKASVVAAPPAAEL